MGATGRALVAAAAALALADASIVALALPPLLTEFDTTITGVAAIVGVYALVIALAIVPAERLIRRPGAGAAGLALFAAGSVVCAVAPSLAVMLAARALQAAGGAVALLAAFEMLDAGASRHGRRVWLGAAVAGTAAGPAIGGVLTEALDWRAIFAVQAPIAAAAAIACWRAAPAPAPPPVREALVPRGLVVPTLSLGLCAAAFTALLFMLVLELVAGFAVGPLRAAVAVTVLPLGAIAATAIRGAPLVRAAAGTILVAGGAAALAFLPGTSLWWTVPPQVLAGVGMGLAIPAFAGELLPERTVGDAARLLVARHAGTVVVLAILAPVATHQLDVEKERAVLEGTALVLDAALPPLDKLDLAPKLLDGVQTERPRAGLREALAAERSSFSAQRAAYDALGARLDNIVVGAVQDAFRTAYLIAGALGLLGAALLVPRALGVAVGAAALLAALTVAVYAVEADRRAPPEVVLPDPCHPPPPPDSGGLGGALQVQALKLLDRAACRAGSTREELALAIADAKRADAYQRKYGVNPRNVLNVLSLLGGG
jgi:predicted MFS family arabinose efflux permease